MKNDAMRRRARGVKLSSIIFCVTVLVAGLPARGRAQVNTGSDGHDGVFAPTTNAVVDMHDHPDGIYQYASVNIRTNVTVTFIPNANNTPVTWLLQGSCVISGTVRVSGQCANGQLPGLGGPGGGAGGEGGRGNSWLAFRGSGLGGGDAAQYNVSYYGGGGSYAAVGGTVRNFGAAAGLTYGNKFLLPLLAGSGGGGGWGDGGGGGGGAILIASDSSILVNGAIVANGGCSLSSGGGGSGGGVRLVAPQISGNGFLQANGGSAPSTSYDSAYGGSGFVRLDALADRFTGYLDNSASRGFNPILVAPTQTVTLAIQSIAGNALPANPTGVLFTPDATISAQQSNPIPVVVSCVNLPLNTPITVVVKPVNGPMVLGSTVNTTGTQAASTATVSMIMPRGGGLIYATAAISH